MRSSVLLFSLFFSLLNKDLVFAQPSATACEAHPAQSIFRFTLNDCAAPLNSGANNCVQSLSQFPLATANKSSVLIFGEQHPDVATKIWLAQLIPTLKKQGYTALGLEMLRTDAGQVFLDRYAAGQIDDKNLAEVFQNQWGWVPNAYVALIKAALAEDMRVLAIDGNSSVSSIPELRSRDKDTQIMNERNLHMAEQVDSYLSHSQKNKIIILLGAEHAFPVFDESTSVANILKTYFNFPSQIYRIAPKQEGIAKSNLQTYFDSRRPDLTPRGALVPTTPACTGYDGYLFTPRF